ncbi:EamA family transporter [Pseudoluteimonas lycopersici]|uniref:EamA family transporter n=1 Tax=Pseudoluteimonas lycopersici TaxID=1324796 RepID=A0A516V898_9GAMM|nr:EamA family transporter [Lysobacter lycopersici]
MRADNVDRKATLGGICAIGLWSSLALLTTLTGALPPFLVLACCFGFAGLFGLTWAARTGTAGLRAMQAPPAALALSTFALFGYHALYFFALKHAPPVEANLINYLWPLLIVLFAGLLPGVRLRAGNIVGALLGLAAAALLVTGGRGLSIDSSHTPGYLAAFCAAITWGGYSVLNRRFADVDSAAIVPACIGVSLLGIAMHLLFEPATTIAPTQWLVLVAMGVGPTGIAFRLWDRGTKHGDIALLGSLSYLAPLLSTLLLVLAGRAEPHWIQTVAVGLLLLGAWMSVRASRAAMPAAAAP